MPRVAIVIPCFNEAQRLDPGNVGELVAGDDMLAILVDDGSTDDTRELLAAISSQYPGKVRVLELGRNRGKAEAVRAGMLAGADEAQLVGYCDADFSTPAQEMLRLVSIIDERRVDVVTGARVARLGATISRKNSRHYLGRVFATGAAITLGHQVYDTQCGAKVFRNTDALRAAIAQPFVSKWAFDVELLGRLMARGATVVEEPLSVWRDIGGSKLRARSALRAGLDLVHIAWDLRRWR